MKEIVLIRHGQSVWNLENRFTGWTDVDLSKRGLEEAREAGILLKKRHYTFDIAYTSILKRASNTLNIILKEMNLTIPIYQNYRLNERHYGALQGLNKEETKQKYGEEQVLLWRRSATVRPPKLAKDDARYPGNDPKYLELSKDELPTTENLNDTIERVVDYFEKEIKPQILDNKKIIIVAHGNSLRGLIKYLEKLTDEEIVKVEIPTGKPLVYQLNDDLTFYRKFYLE